MNGEQRTTPERERIASTVVGALPNGLVRWAARRAAAMARLSGRTSLGAATLARTLGTLASPPQKLWRRSGSVPVADVAERVDRDVDELRRWRDAGLLEPLADDEWDRSTVDRAILVDLALRGGATEQELRGAAEQDGLTWLAFQTVLTRRGHMTGLEAAHAAGLPDEAMQRIWRALGLASGELEAKAFDRRDVHALRTLDALGAVFTEDDLAESASVIGRAMAEVATSTTDIFRRRIAVPFLEAGTTPTDVIARLAAMRDLLVPTLAPLLEVALQRHLEAAIRSEVSIALEHMIEPGAGHRVVAVAFADLVGFTAASEVWSPVQVRRAASTLLEIAEDAVARRSGRIVKTIGDAVMFTTAEPLAAAQAGVDIVEAVAMEESLPPVRVGIAHGPVLPGYADLFGRTVNLASRLCTAAAAGEVLLALAEGAEAARAAAWADGGLMVQERSVDGLKGIDAEVPALVVHRITP